MERKSAVFSLAISQVLIINMFEHDVGRYNGANYGLLKTVFDVNLQLFQAAGSPKTLLLFVIRDHAQTPLESLADTLRADLKKIWSDLSKPSGLEQSQFDDFFDVKFTALPHKVYQYDNFVKGVEALRAWFTDPNDPNFLFQPRYHKQIPADGFSMFVSDIWVRHHLFLSPLPLELTFFRSKTRKKSTATRTWTCLPRSSCWPSSGVTRSPLGLSTRWPRQQRSLRPRSRGARSLPTWVRPSPPFGLPLWVSALFFLVFFLSVFHSGLFFFCGGHKQTSTTPQHTATTRLFTRR